MLKVNEIFLPAWYTQKTDSIISLHTKLLKNTGKARGS
jgi:hypothetical protein